MTNRLVLGFFDGIHSAHIEVIKSANKSRDDNTKVILLTFKESPSLYFNNTAEYIMTRENSINKAMSIGVDEVIEQNFKDIAQITAEEYLKDIVLKYSPESISTGFNHTFGFNKQGNSQFLKDREKLYNYKYICTPPYTINNEVISSSLIKRELKSGNITKANKILCSNFTLSGTVIKGKQIGRTIGFPTANIKYPVQIVKIPYGVYKSKVRLDKNGCYDAIVNWGIKPTVNDTFEPIVETHLLNYSEDLYNKNIDIEILDKIRDEIKFNNISELKQQIERDIKCLKS